VQNKDLYPLVQSLSSTLSGKDEWLASFLEKTRLEVTNLGNDE